MEVFVSFLEHQPFLTLFLVIATGYGLGSINTKGLSLGSRAVILLQHLLHVHRDHGIQDPCLTLYHRLITTGQRTGRIRYYFIKFAVVPRFLYRCYMVVTSIKTFFFGDKHTSNSEGFSISLRTNRSTTLNLQPWQ
jgi:hypothetical protein